MYNSLFCRMYNEFGWNEYPRVFAEQLLEWLRRRGVTAGSALDLGCGTGVLCETLHAAGIRTLGVDISENMIDIARERSPELDFYVGDMVSFEPDERFDLVTCTGDALNHVIALEDVRAVFAHVWTALNPGGLFVFDLLKEDEVPEGEPFTADFTEHLRVHFSATRDADGFTTLRIDAYDGDALKFRERIREKLHALETIREMLVDTGFAILQCADQLLTDSPVHGTTWFIVAQKQR